MKNENNNLTNLRHSTAHLLAAAVLRLWPDTKLTIGPAIENGFYYDFEFSQPISEENFKDIEKKMADTIKEWESFSHREVSEQEAKEFYKNNPYKQELIDEIVAKGEKITFYKCGRFEDLCRGGHSENPKNDIGAFKLLSVAGAYWRGSEKNTMLTRIYGTAFGTKEELDEYLNQLEEAKKRDHKKLGRELDLFFFAESSPGMTYWLPKGLIVYNTLYDFARQMYKKFNYQEVATPQLNKKELYETSGHWFHYRQDMFIAPMSFIRDESKELLEGTEVFGLKPMNCPNAMTIFGMKTRSYNDLPMRLGETTLLHRFELSGTLNGLFRTRQFRQDDAHIFMTIEQLKTEFAALMQMVAEMYAPFGLSYKLRFGTRPESFMGEGSDWDIAEKMLKEALDESKEEYFVAEGEGAFYGPKVDILMRDSIGREWQTGTIQLDFQQPKNFKLKYTTNDGTEKQPVVMHRALFGSFERFLGILIEHFAGALPIWLSPVQVAILPIADRHSEFANKVHEILLTAGIRSEVNMNKETLQNKIRLSASQKVPYIVVIGDKEIEAEKIAVRARGNEDLGQIGVEEFVKRIQSEITNKIS